MMSRASIVSYKITGALYDDCLELRKVVLQNYNILAAARRSGASTAGPTFEL